MSLIDGLVVVSGLVIFEIVVSIDNAIINAHVLRSMAEKWRKFFLLFGILTAVLLMRLVLPLLMVWLLVPDISLDGMAKLFTEDGSLAHDAIEQQKYLILSFGGMFLLLVYFHWLFMEKKRPLFAHERLLKNHDVWFFAFAAILLVAVMYLARSSPPMMITTAMGSAGFFILYGFKESAEKKEESMANTEAPDVSRFLYLEVLDMIFSFDSVIGAFAFTTNLLYIFLGLGAGALALRELTIMGIKKISGYVWLKNGAMTSIAFLGIFMLLESFNLEVPKSLPTLVTLSIVGYAFYMSNKNLKKIKQTSR
ncbi:MAG: DUF475 domain-containing protein [Candidatus Aenigmarchaeota archaeon]|nr:DUF475 domain-containing protein [Candidatus Aenigmarchaeota archaeon]